MSQDKPWLDAPTVDQARPLPTGGVYIPPTMSPKEEKVEQREDRKTEIIENKEARDVLEFNGKGAPRSGYQWNADRTALAPIPGGPEDKPDRTKDIDLSVKELKRAIDAAKRAKGLSQTGWFATGAGAETMSGIGGTAAADVAALMNTVGAKAAFDRLQRMREESPTGGALGGIAVKELELLRDSVASLSQSQSDEQFQQNMDIVVESYTDLIRKLDPKAADELGQDQAAPAPIGGVMGREVPLPEGYQEAHDKFLAGIPRGKLDPAQYEAFRMGIDKQFGLPAQEPGAYSDSSFVKSYNDPAKGVSGKVPTAVTPMGFLEGNARALTVLGANGVLGGAMDELAPILGLDPQQVQMAKEYLSEKYPLAALAGTITGGASALAGLGVVAPGVAATRGGALALDAGYGAFSGAMENNDNRLLGAALGGGAGFVGNKVAGKVASKFNESGVVDDLAPLPESAPLPKVEPSVTSAEAEDIAALARKAVTVAPGRAKAKRQLAEMAKVNPEAQAAADRLGVELPVDILSDDVRLMSLAGLPRSQQGSQAANSWYAMVRDTSQKADEAFEAIGASKDLSKVSQDVFDRIEGSMQSLQRNAKTLRNEVDEAIDVRAPVEATQSQTAIQSMVDDLGGKDALSGEEKKLLAMFTDGDGPTKPTYARLNLIRDQIGDAMDKGKGPWVDTAKANLKRYYAALAQDQLEHVRTVGGDDLADKMKGSNTLFTQMYAAREDLVATFGDDLSKSLATTLSTAVTKGAKGDISGINKVLARVPEDMRGQALLSGLFSAARKDSPEGGFSFGKYTKLYRGIRENSEVYKALAKEFGDGGEQVLADLYAISKRVDAGEQKVLKTGKALQGAQAILNAENLVTRILRTTAGKAAGTVAIASGAGPVGAGVASVAQEAIRGSARGKSDAVHQLLTSNEFRELAERMGSNDVSDAAINKLADSQPFAKFSRTQLGLKTFKDRATWIKSAFIAAPQQVEE